MQPEPDQATITFTRDLNSGLRRVFGTDFNSDQERQSGGVAAADFDNDGDVDLLVVGGNTEPNHLYANQGDGTFVEIAADVGLDFVNWASGVGPPLATSMATVIWISLSAPSTIRFSCWRIGWTT